MGRKSSNVSECFWPKIGKKQTKGRRGQNSVVVLLGDNLCGKGEGGPPDDVPMSRKNPENGRWAKMDI